ncbi:MAG: hypothetical protein IKH89_00480 [Bacteroidales bacterium]|nr:hypothetical protein [Bacteroidales bacterium]
MDYLTLNKLEKDILNLYEDGKPYSNQMEYRREGLGALLARRKELLDSEMLRNIRKNDYCGFLSSVKSFNEDLKGFIEDASHNAWEALIFVAGHELKGQYEDTILTLKCFLDESPEGLSKKNNYGENIWDILNNSVYHPQYQDGFYQDDFLIGLYGEAASEEESSAYKAELESKKNQKPEKALTKELFNLIPELIDPIRFLLDNTYFALQDFLFCKKFRVEMDVQNWVEFSS